MFSNLHLLQNLDATAVTAAWVVLFAWLGAKAIPRWWRDPTERRLLPVILGVALLLRLALPWGPLNFVDGERLECVWGLARQLPDHFPATPLLLSVLRDLGFSPGTLLRWAAPVAGSLAVLTTYLAARGFGLRRETALTAAAIVCVWPAHLHYSTSLSFSVEGMPFWLGAFALVAEGGEDSVWRSAAVTSLAVLGVYSRPEFRLLVVPLAVLALGRGWTWKQRGVLAVFLAVGLVSYVPHLVPEPGSLSRSGHSAGFVPRILRGATMTPSWWIFAGLFALVRRATPLRWNVRVALILSLALLGTSYWFMSSEANPRWGQWRYYAALIPFIALAASAFTEWAIDKVPEAYRRPWTPLIPLALALAPLPFVYPAVRHPEDLATESAWIRATARQALGARRDVLILANRGHEGLSSIAVEGNPTMAIATAVGPIAWTHGCEDTAGRVEVRDLERVLAECPERIDPARTLVYLGLFRDDERIAPLRARYDLVPVAESHPTVALTSTMVNRQCPADPTGYTLEGLGARPCPVRLGWYRLVPR